MKVSELSLQSDYIVRTSDGSFEGKYIGREDSEGLSFHYLRNESAEYRITLVVLEEKDFYAVDVNGLTGSHETFVRMGDLLSIRGK